VEKTLAPRAWKSLRDSPFPQPQQQQILGYISNVSTNPRRVTFLNVLTGFEAMLERGNKAKADMDRDNARLERLALLKKGVLRGRRKEFAVMPTDGIEFRG
jgi:hypothetical protein